MSRQIDSLRLPQLHVGLTYDLRSQYLAEGYGEVETAEFDRDETVDEIEDALRKLGHRTDRIGHARQLTARLAAGSRWDLVFNICEGLNGPAREAQVPAMLDAFGIPYTFSDPLVMALSLHKGMTKTIVRDAGIPTPGFAVVQQRSDLDRLELEYPLFAKPVAEGTGKGVDATSVIREPSTLWPVCQRLLSQFGQPVLVEQFLPGREFTVGLVGSGGDAKLLGTLEILLRPDAEPDVYSYSNKEQCERYVDYPLVSPSDDAVVREAEAIALQAWRAVGCRDAGRVDLRCDVNGRPQFIEVNPLAGLHPLHSDLPMICHAVGISYVQLIERIIQSAAQRLAGPSLAIPKARADEVNSVAS